MAEIDLAAQIPADPGEAAAIREARAHAAAWLAKNSGTGTSTQSAAIRLFREVRAERPPKDLEPGIDRLLSLQNADGGWGQLKGLPSDAFATGQALYFLSIAGVVADRPEIRRGMTFLVGSQKPDGSWPMTSRAHPGAKPFKNPVPITYFGSAWATLGLLRSVPSWGR
jgi:squalene cyclase